MGMLERFVCLEKGTGLGRCHTPAVLSRTPFLWTAFLALAALCLSCSSSRKIGGIVSGEVRAGLSLPEEPSDAGAGSVPESARFSDTVIVKDIDGREVTLMKAVLDEESGEMVASEQIRASFVSARFRNVAERHGRVDIAFDVTVPAGLRDSKWQLRFHPVMAFLGDTVRLDDILITGAGYRKAQLRGYQQYERFISRIVSDPSRFVDRRNLELFLERNIPEVFAFRNDSSIVSDERFASAYGVTARQAVDHYTRHFAMMLNDRRKSRAGEMWKRYVKAPIVSEGIRLDTVIQASNGDFIYSYVQPLATRSGLRKVDVSVSGQIFDQDRMVCRIPECEPLTFYISSLSTLAEPAERYLTRIIERDVKSEAVCYIDFHTGSAEIDEEIGDNGRGIASIKKILRSLLMDEALVLDSVMISASASPEGQFASNASLSSRRAAGAAAYFRDFVSQVSDSLVREDGLFFAIGGGPEMKGPASREIQFRSRSAGENWALLDHLVKNDVWLSPGEKLVYERLRAIDDRDRRERELSGTAFYPYVFDNLYPQLRTVQFDFRLHRKGMLKDTVHTTVLDSTYLKGVLALRDRDYDSAVALLSPYGDLNSAIACLAADRNLSALRILEACPESPKVDYMLALAYSRLGDERKAVEYYKRSCERDASFIHRGNLDPEIAGLARRYKTELEL